MATKIHGEPIYTFDNVVEIKTDVLCRTSRHSFSIVVIQF